MIDEDDAQEPNQPGEFVLTPPPLPVKRVSVGISARLLRLVDQEGPENTITQHSARSFTTTVETKYVHAMVHGVGPYADSTTARRALDNEEGQTYHCDYIIIREFDTNKELFEAIDWMVIINETLDLFIEQESKPNPPEPPRPPIEASPMVREMREKYALVHGKFVEKKKKKKRKSGKGGKKTGDAGKVLYFIQLEKAVRS